PQPPKVQVVDPRFVQGRRQLRLRETRPPGAGNRPDVNEQLDLLPPQRLDEGRWGRVLIADRGKDDVLGHLFRWERVSRIGGLPATLRPPAAPRSCRSAPMAIPPRSAPPPS